MPTTNASGPAALCLAVMALAGCVESTAQQDDYAVTSAEESQRCAQLSAMDGRPWHFESCLMDWTTLGARLQQMGHGYCDGPPSLQGEGLADWEQLVRAEEPAVLYHWRALSEEAPFSETGEVFVVHHLGEETTRLSFYGADGDDLLLEGTWETERWFYPPAWIEIDWETFAVCREPDGPR